MKNIKLLIFADTHLGFDFPVNPRIQRRRRGPDFFEKFRAILREAKNEKVDFVVHGGDLFFRSKLPPKIIDLVYHDLFEFAHHGIPLYIVPGNHERSLLPQSLFLGHPNIHVFDVPKTFLFETENIKVGLSGFPCVRYDIKSNFVKILPNIDPNHDIKLLCMHQTVEGAQVEHFTFRAGQDVIPMRDIPPHFDAVLSGHIHRKQILRKFIDRAQTYLPVIYPGSVERTSFAEKNEPKGYFIIEFRYDDLNGKFTPKLLFKELNTRPMVDINLPNTISSDNLEDYLRKRIKALPAEAVVRLKASKHISNEIRTALTNSFLRSIFPETMNFQLSADFYQLSDRI